MGRHHDGSPAIGATVEILRSAGTGSFEPALVIDRLTDPILGLVVEVQFTDSLRMQRMWPSPTMRLA